MYATRFAPTPSGRLHFGSLVAAVGAYLRARSMGGKIYLRLEDLDFPRCKKEYTQSIIEDLKILGFSFDDKPYIQSEHLDFYEAKLKALVESKQCFYCHCTRASLKVKACSCEGQNFKDGALKIALNAKPYFYDNHLGTITLKHSLQDNLTLKRSDGLISYNFACVLDDELMGITEIVRGSDLIETTPLQIALIHALNFKAQAYFHLPLALEENGLKLSKQNHAKAVLDEMSAQEALLKALKFLGQNTDTLQVKDKPEVILACALEQFLEAKIPKVSQKIANLGTS